MLNTVYIILTLNFGAIDLMANYIIYNRVQLISPTIYMDS